MRVADGGDFGLFHKNGSAGGCGPRAPEGAESDSKRLDYLSQRARDVKKRRGMLEKGTRGRGFQGVKEMCLVFSTGASALNPHALLIQCAQPGLAGHQHIGSGPAVCLSAARHAPAAASFSRRFASASRVTSSSSRPARMSIVMRSPLLDQPRWDRRKGFGVTCPTQAPWDAPEKRPSVTSGNGFSEDPCR